MMMCTTQATGRAVAAAGDPSTNSMAAGAAAETTIQFLRRDNLYLLTALDKLVKVIDTGIVGVGNDISSSNSPSSQGTLLHVVRLKRCNVGNVDDVDEKNANRKKKRRSSCPPTSSPKTTPADVRLREQFMEQTAGVCAMQARLNALTTQQDLIKSMLVGRGGTYTDADLEGIMRMYESVGEAREMLKDSIVRCKRKLSYMAKKYKAYTDS